MGQQQLLLLVLGIVIVGLAVVAGISAFDENQQKSSQDALTNEGFRLASDAKAWFNKPAQYDGGGSDATELNNITWGDIGVAGTSLSDSDASNADGEYNTPWGTVTMNEGNPLTFDIQTNNASAAFGTVTFNPGLNAGNQIQFSRGGS